MEKIEVGNCIFTLRWNPRLYATATSPAEGGDFEVEQIEYTGPASKEDVIRWEEQAIAEAWNRKESP